MHVKGGNVMAPILIIPGLGGSGPHHWQTCLERSFPATARVHQDDWDRPDRGTWVERLASAIEAAPGAVLVAHSLGCAVVAHLAAERPDLTIEAALLVAPADVESADHTPAHLRCFAPMPRGRLPFRSVVVPSTNDPFITLARARELADAWGADFVDAGPLGHINVDAGLGLGPWPAGERILRRLMTARREPRFSAPLSAQA
jgi:predicted alpha/beta hydrolase family esterase